MEIRPVEAADEGVLEEIRRAAFEPALASFRASAPTRPPPCRGQVELAALTTRR